MSGPPSVTEVGELRLAAESIEALATRLAELLGTGRRAEPFTALPLKLTAAEVARWWGVERSWVYGNATELGAQRLGSGPRPRLRFDPDAVAEALGAPIRLARMGPDGRRLAPIGADSLSPPSRAIVAEQGNQAAGRRGNAPGPAPREARRREGKRSLAEPSRRPPAAGKRGGER